MPQLFWPSKKKKKIYLNSLPFHFFQSLTFHRGCALNTSTGHPFDVSSEDLKAFDSDCLELPVVLWLMKGQRGGLAAATSPQQQRYSEAETAAASPQQLQQQ